MISGVWVVKTMTPRHLILALCIALVALAAATSQARATTLVLADGTVAPQPYQSWVDRANVPTIDATVTLRFDGCGDLPGCVADGEMAVDLDPEWATPHILLHELGHLFDDRMPGWVRTQFEGLVGAGDWLSDSGEQFAEAYSLCARKRTIRRQTAQGYRYDPTPAQHRQACGLIRRAGAA
jgi:hypothetical protein